MRLVVSALKDEDDSNRDFLARVLRDLKDFDIDFIESLPSQYGRY